MTRLAMIAAVAAITGSVAMAAEPVAPLPPADELPVVADLSDPLLAGDGTRITTPQQWLKRRDELNRLFQHYMYGHLPPAPGNVTGEVIRSVKDGDIARRLVRLSFGPDKKLHITLSLAIPPGDGPHPVMLYLHRANQFRDEWGRFPDDDLIVQRGYIAATYANGDLVRDDVKPQERGYLAEYPDCDGAVLAIWAWGMHRCVDYLVTLPEVDAGKIAVSGHSRRGKAALLAAAFDERIAVAAPNGSGTGGTDPSRFAKEGVEVITRKFPQWFSPQFRDFADRPQRLPFDQHMLVALAAPRACISTDALDDEWVSPAGVEKAMRAAAPVYKLLGVGDFGERLDVHFRPGKHNITSEDWTAILDFCGRQFAGGK